ncbi:MAG: hypothetical protein ACRDZY_14775, partial [Acidimicrobiales bacterium]
MTENNAASTPDAAESTPRAAAVPAPELPPVEVVRRIEVSRAALRRNNPATSGHSVVVYLTKAGAYEIGSGRLSMGELWLSTPQKMFLVDVAPHQEKFLLELPAAGDAFCFSADVRVTWRVRDVVAAVKDERDPRALVRDFVEERLREVTRKFDVEQSADAEQRVQREYQDRTGTVTEAVELSACTAVLGLNEEIREHIAGRRRSMQKVEAAENNHSVTMVTERFAREIEALKQKHDLELKQERMKVYADALRSDDVNLLALRLSGHDEDVKDVLELVMEQKKRGFEQASGVLDSLLAANLVNRKDVAALMQEAGSTLLGLPQKAPEPPPVTAK